MRTRSNSMQKKITKMSTYVILTVLAISFLLPLLWMIVTSLKSYQENLSYPPTLLPSSLFFENYTKGLFDFFPFFKYFGNSVFIAVIGVTATLFTASLVAFGFARIKVMENKALFWIVLATMMLPTQVTMVSSYVIWSYLGMVDTYVPLLIAAFFGGSPFFIFLIRQFFMTLPRELDEAAQIDGCSLFGIYWRIYLPLSKPILGTVAIFAFQGYWNDYMGPLIYIKDESKYTVALALTLFDMPHETLWGPMMAASLITIAPVVTLFFIFQKHFINSISLNGVKK